MSTWETTNRCGNLILQWSNKLFSNIKYHLVYKRKIYSIWIKYKTKLSFSILYQYVYNTDQQRFRLRSFRASKFKYFSEPYGVKGLLIQRN